jgi:AraC-like DNA-binding protein
MLHERYPEDVYSRGFRVYTTVRKDDWLGRLGDYCRDNIIHGLTVAELARHAGMSRQNLRRRLQNACGMTPKAYVDSIRFDIACRQLRTTQEPVEIVSRYCGYASPSVFTRRFRKLSGVSPRQWRQQNREV